MPLTRRAGGIRQAYKLVIPASSHGRRPDPQTHEGYDRLHVLDGRLQLILGDHDLVLTAGEAARVRHPSAALVRAAGPEPVELLSLFGRQGERAHLRARSTTRRRS